MEEDLIEALEFYYDNPTAFLEDLLGMKCDDWQEKVAADVAAYPKVTVKSGQGVGKTALEAGLIIWFLACRPYSKVIATAPTAQQLYNVLWAEIAKWLNSSLIKNLLTWTKTKVYMTGDSERWFAIAKTATKPENMQGFHEDHMLIVVDEASGVAEPIMEAILGTLTGWDNKLLLMGNPTKTSGTFYDSHTVDCKMYRHHTVNSETSRRTDKDNIAALKRKYGENSNVVKVRVYGEFPEQEDDVFIPISFLEQSIKTEMSEPTARAFGKYRDGAGNLQPVDVSGVELIEIGCDVARFGDDKTCIGYRVNEVVQIYKKYNGKDTTWTASMIARLYKELKQRFRFQGQIGVKVDDGGVGGGVVDQLRNWKRSDPEVFGDMAILAVNFGVPIKHRHYADSTTYMMGVVRDLIAPYDDFGRPHVPEVILPDDSDLIGQLSCRKFEFGSNAKQKVESKQDMKDRGLSSPDEGDCILLVCLPMNYKKKGGKS